MTQPLEILEQMKAALDDAYASGVRNATREWVGLTEDDVCKNLLADGYSTEAEFIRAVHLVEATEKILKEKNT